MKSKAEQDLDAIEHAHEIVALVEDAIYKTMTAALNPGVVHSRRSSKAAWIKVTDKVIEFAMEDD